MTIPEKSWIKYINMLSAVSKTAARKFSAYLNDPGHDISSKAGRKAAIDYAAALADAYGESAAAVACQMYDAVAEASKVTLPPAVPAPTPEYGEVAKAVNGMLKHNQGSDAIGASIGRLVKRTGVDTTLQNALRDGAEFAWVPHGDTCSFCIMLASNGWQKASKKTIKGDHAEHIHANCDCTFAVRFDGKSGVKGYDPDKYREIYDNAEGNTWQEKLNSMRRDEYAANAEKIRAQKREAYEARKGLLNKNRDDIINIIGKAASTEASDAWASLSDINLRSSQPMQHGFSAFPSEDELQANAKKVKPESGFFDVALHGNQTGVGFGTIDTNMTAHDLAVFIRHQDSYNGEAIRLLACRTGERFGDGRYCFAEELSNALGVEVKAPDDLLYINKNGEIRIGAFDQGRFETFKPNERRRLK